MIKRMKNIISAFVFITAVFLLTSCYDALSEKLAEFAPENELLQTDKGAEGEESAGAVETAPDFTVCDNDGNEISLSDKFGKPVIVNFWATWCGPCKSELPIFDAAYLAHGDKVEFMMVDLTDGYNDTPEKVMEFVKAEGYSFPVYHDVSQDAAKTYGITSVPLTIFLNPDGSMRYYQIGALDAETLEFAVNDLLSLTEE